MKIQFYGMSLLSLILLVTSNSCKERLSHTDAIKYYSTVTGLTHMGITKVNSFIKIEMGYVSAEKGMSANDGSKEITEATNDANMDSLKSKNEEILSATDNIINALDTVTEIDTHIGLKSEAIKYVKQAKRFQAETFKYVLTSLPNKNLTDDQRSEALAPLKEARDGMKSSGAVYIDAAKEYRDKYNIPDNDQ